ncbi:hypothetical protein FH972_023154 [Carpinus fangiana]|uniref:glucan 1,3-beta-glucosidase n=1 Tax=Carpinus fangiana TaxID=176857 RepID=A0A5N6KUC2_9ROSI|nr:hypothetical protein FH972_023154 [Carpinus fangiana]
MAVEPLMEREIEDRRGTDAYKKAGLAFAEHRIAMCRLATKESDWIMVDDWEASKAEYTRTALVLDHIEHEINEVNGGVRDSTGIRRKAKVALMSGADLIDTMSVPGVWAREDLDHILGRYGAFIIERMGTDLVKALETLEPWRDNIYAIPQLIQNDVSSTKVRQFLRKDMSISRLALRCILKGSRGDESHTLLANNATSKGVTTCAKVDTEMCLSGKATRSSMDSDPPGIYHDRGRHARENSYGHLLPHTRSAAIRPGHPVANSTRTSRRTTSGRIPSSSYAEKHRAQFSQVESSRAPSLNVRSKSGREAEVKVTKRKGRKRRTTLDHNHYRDTTRTRDISQSLNLDLEKATFSSPKEPRQSRVKNLSNRSNPWSRRRKCIFAATIGSRRSSAGHNDVAAPMPTQPSNSNLNGIAPSSIPEGARGTYLDPFTWYDTTDFNLTYTNETVGGLPLMGLNSTYSDDTRANAQVPPLTSKFMYGTTPIRGVNLGGWLSLEPFITPSLFSSTSTPPIVDEYTLTASLGANAPNVLEKHYATFIKRDTFAAIRAAGFDHIRISFSYWSVTTYPGDPYVRGISFRYLLRAIEYCRMNGLRVNLDLHGVPGSQNGWNHSGRLGPIGWLNGTDGQLNADRTLNIHRQLTTFFAQPRYANIVTMYGLVNEPRMAALNQSAVLNWTATAITILRQSGMPQSTVAVIGDGFLGLANWVDSPLLLLPNTSTQNLLLDAHQYAIFALDQLALPHAEKLAYVCDGFAQQTNASMNSSKGFGNFICGEWSQADTDCAPNLNNVGAGSRWEGTYLLNEQPNCPLKNSSCSCQEPNGDPKTYREVYKTWLQHFAAGQMKSFNYGWGSFYWTWLTEEATQWSWKLGMEAGILPSNVRMLDESVSCEGGVDWAGQGLGETI